MRDRKRREGEKEGGERREGEREGGGERERREGERGGDLINILLSSS